MKIKPIATILFICIFSGAFSKEPVRYGIIAGMNISRWDLTSSESKIGFHAGLKMEIPAYFFSNNTFIEAGGYYTLKGGKLDLLSTIGKYDFKFEYIELPVRVCYKYPVGKHFSLTGKAGPYISFALSSKEIQEKNAVSLSKNENGEWIKENVLTSTTYDLFDFGFRKIDAGFGFLFGIEFCKVYQFSFGKDWGFFPTVNDQFKISNSGKKKNSNLFLSISYLL